MPTFRQKTLHHVVSSAQQHMDFMETKAIEGLLPSTSTQHIAHFDVLPLTLSSSLSQFEDRMLRHGVPKKFMQLALARASEIAASYEQSYVTTCQQIMATPFIQDGAYNQEMIQHLQRMFEDTYENQDLAGFLSEILKSGATSLPKTHTPHDSALPELERKPYNHSFTPYLEAYFQQNAYPSTADRKSLARQAGMSDYQIATWFQNHRNRAKAQGIPMNRLSHGQSINEELIKSKIQMATTCYDDAESDGDSCIEGTANPSEGLRLDELASFLADSIPKAYTINNIEPCVTSSEAFGLPALNRRHPIVVNALSQSVNDLEEIFGDINIRIPAATPSKTKTSKATSSKSKLSSRASTPNEASKPNPLKATLRSCFSAAITLTCPRSHPAMIRPKKMHTLSPQTGLKNTALPQEPVKVQSYRLPEHLPSWELPTAPKPDLTSMSRRKKPTIPSHSGKSHPGSPYPKQTISRMSSSSSLASMDSTDSQDSQSSSRTASSNFSSSTNESLFSETHTPSSLSPSPVTTELIDDDRFPDDLFGDYFLYQQEPSDFDLFVEDAFDRNVSMSLSDFTTTTLPDFTYFES